MKEQLQFLNKRFVEEKYPSTRLKLDMASILNLPYKRIQCWFNYRRAKWRRQKANLAEELKRNVGIVVLTDRAFPLAASFNVSVISRMKIIKDRLRIKIRLSL